MRLKNGVFTLIVLLGIVVALYATRPILPNPNPLWFEAAKAEVSNVNTNRIGFGAWEVTGQIANHNTCTHNVALKILFYGPDNAVVGVVPGKVNNLTAGETRTFRFYTAADISPQVRHQIIVELAAQN